MNRGLPIWLTIALVLPSPAVARQTEGEPDRSPKILVDWGFKAGVLSSNLRSPEGPLPPGQGLALGGSNDFRWRANFIGGMYADVAPGGLGLTAEVLVERRGAVLHTRGREDRWDLWTLQVPVLARWTAGAANRNLVPYVLAGPAFGVRLRSTLHATTAGTHDLNPDLTIIDVAAVVGGGVRIRRLLLDVRYAHGLRNLAENSTRFLLGATVRSHSVAVLTGFQMR